MTTFKELFEHLRSLSNNGIVDAATAAEYMKDGRFSYAYIVRKHKIKQPQGEFNLAVKEHFGTLTPQVEEAESEITKQEFLALYRFGLFPNVRQWVSKIKQETGKYLALQDLYKWVLDTKG
tara:strand:+ start:2641 stop:3003 length:363 start_codon:yes stop_codon:yes gene_type:complete